MAKKFWWTVEIISIIVFFGFCILGLMGEKEIIENGYVKIAACLAFGGLFVPPIFLGDWAVNVRIVNEDYNRREK